MTKGRTLVAMGLLALSPAALSPVAWANHVRIEVTPEATPPASTVIVTPGVPAVTSYAPAPVPQTLQAEEIKAHQVRAQTIYANKIEADDVQGAIHQTKGVKVRDSRGEIKAPYVGASVIYADEIKANSVVAEHIYVRELKRR